MDGKTQKKMPAAILDLLPFKGGPPRGPVLLPHETYGKSTRIIILPKWLAALLS